MSTNISKKRREDLLNKINEIKNYLMENFTNGDFVKYLSELENEIKGTKYGLIYEEHREKVDEILDTHTPVFVEDKELFIDNDGQLNFLIEGDNLPALKLLTKTHKGKIDVIFIDPPYNRGSNDFIYDDDFVDKEDTYKHSKWLSFMEKRLIQLKLLMKNSSFICITIDDNEQANLKLLCDKVFGPKNFVACIPRRTKSSGKTTNKIASNHDYALIYARDINNVIIEGFEHVDKDFKYKDEFVDIRGPYKLNQTLDYDSLQYSPSLDYPITIDGETFYPGTSYEKYLERQNGNYKRADWAWRWSKDLFEFGFKNGFIVVKGNKKGGKRIYTKTYLNAKIKKTINGYEIEYYNRKKPLSSLDLTDSIYSNDNAKKDLNLLFDEIEFDYPKPVELIKKIISLNPSKHLTILDCFAGSGTTGQSTLELNKDGGKRKFILVTNNQNNICKEVTYERIKRVIEKEGYKASLKYYKLDYVNTDKQLYYEYADKLLLHVKELVQLENGINLENNPKVWIAITDEELEIFINSIDKNKKCKKLYLGHDVLFSKEQEEILKKYNIKTVTIPDYYYRELKG
ncbi:site-specific DNA-methyltransferase [Acetivibrio straminisolvens]|jgi:adenine-specific DNA-methyltransferase|uniref:site-specific DNA-methyltransferase n=1 Tax=Acetivibrio straminisolvens TaxID=253314 RepID=UPI00223EED37|nr:site-specific DNA-methyltransferase [Acetivibrio straminisolvens]